MRSALWLFVLASCAESAADTPRDPFAKPPPVATLTVELGAVTLGDDCAPASPPVKPEQSPASEVPSTPAAPMKTKPGGVPYRGHCDQTTMQLLIKTPADQKAGVFKVKIKKVELLDTEGKPLQTLSARNPRAWMNHKGAYEPWIGSVGPGANVNSMYDLTAPDWNKLTNGRWNAHSKSFQVRVVVEIGSATKTVTKQAITATRLPPPVPT